MGGLSGVGEGPASCCHAHFWELQKREDELQRQQKETFSLKQKKDSLLAELQAWEHLIYQLQTELEKWRVKFGQLQNELGTSSKLYGQAKRQLEDLKTIVQQHRHSSVDNQNVPIAEEAHWHDAFVTLKCDFTELEKIHLEALLQLSHRVYVTKDRSIGISKATSKLDDTKKELEGVCADLVMVMQELDLARAEIYHKAKKLGTQQKELLEAQNQYSACYEEVMDFED
ncbi:hypothetical protein Y1Q_0003730 [Alligator mississippiensis]|uniref:Uncharacterized protein n=1 Tax=Alligator mississippiensis TaxID=8496 RepID=A0A151MN27_ALLMI|nr:hypothetical protein Y1Q_0003730 [Alligator mississippiensis]